jgi:Skp family chaperone for outer membrane proteins
LQREILQRVQSYASAQKYDLVLADAIYVAGALDITQAVITALQSATPPPAAPAPKK